MPVISVDPFRCRMWAGHERLEDEINEYSCKDEIESMSKQGQLLPVLGRSLSNDPTHNYELVYGARRLFVARHLNVPLQVELRAISDREAIVALDIENRLRKELSPYERGRSYAAWLRAGLFDSQEELSQVLNVSASQVSRLLKFAQLPAVVLSAFPTPLEICEGWGRDLMDAWDDAGKRRLLTGAARALAEEGNKSRTSVSVYHRLISATGGMRRAMRAVEVTGHDEVIKDDEGKPLFRVRQHRRDIALLLPAVDISSDALLEIKAQVSAILRKGRTRPATPRQTEVEDGMEIHLRRAT